MTNVIKCVKFFFFLNIIIIYSNYSYSLEMASHEATYEMGLLNDKKSNEIESITGKSVFKLLKECDGWISSEEYFLEFSYMSGQNEIIVSKFNSWEEFSGKVYFFDIHEGSTFEPEKKFNGYVNLPPNTDKPEAFFSSEPKDTMLLPETVFFPVAHTQELIKRAINGKKIFPANLFMGAEPDRALKKTSSIIGAIQTNENFKKNTELLEEKYYPVQVAYFDPNSNESIPEYEITFHMQKNGIVSYYEVDYGDFAISAKLVELKSKNNNSC